MVEEKEITYKNNGVIAKWRGLLTSLLKEKPNAEIININRFDEVDKL